jgi:hypothetical protein
MLRLHHVNTIHQLGDLQIVASRAGIRICVTGRSFGTDGVLRRTYSESSLLTLPAARQLYDAIGAAISEVAAPAIVERAA